MNDSNKDFNPAAREGLGGPVEVKRAQLLADPTVHAIAEALEIEPEEYVEQVLHYAKNKDAEPELKVADEEDLYDAGVEPVDALEILQWIGQIADGTISLDATSETVGDGFDRDNGGRKDTLMKAISATTPTRRAPVQNDQGGKVLVSNDGVGNQLKDLIQRQKLQSINNRRRSLRSSR